MTQYTVSVKDESKAAHILALLKDLAYVDIFTQAKPVSVSKKRPSEIITPIITDTFVHYSREDLNER